MSGKRKFDACLVRSDHDLELDRPGCRFLGSMFGFVALGSIDSCKGVVEYEPGNCASGFEEWMLERQM